MSTPYNTLPWFDSGLVSQATKSPIIDFGNMLTTLGKNADDAKQQEAINNFRNRQISAEEEKVQNDKDMKTIAQAGNILKQQALAQEMQDKQNAKDATAAYLKATNPKLADSLGNYSGVVPLELLKGENSPYMTIGEGGVLIDKKSGKPVYTAPKTFKDPADKAPRFVPSLFGLNGNGGGSQNGGPSYSLTNPPQKNWLSRQYNNLFGGN